MNKEEIKKELIRLNNKAFMLNMKDRWSNADFEENRKLNNEIFRLEKELENM